MNITYECFQFCWDQGAYLAEFLTSEEEARVNAILAHDIDYWIGLADFAHEGLSIKENLHFISQDKSLESGLVHEGKGSEGCRRLT